MQRRTLIIFFSLALTLVILYRGVAYGFSYAILRTLGMDDTQFAPDFSEWNFRQVNYNSTKETVIMALGPPIRKQEVAADGIYQAEDEGKSIMYSAQGILIQNGVDNFLPVKSVWMYTKPGTHDRHLVRTLIFEDKNTLKYKVSDYSFD